MGFPLLSKEIHTTDWIGTVCIFPFLIIHIFFSCSSCYHQKILSLCKKTSWMKGNCEFTVYYIFPHFCGFSFVDNLAGTGQGRMKWTIL